MKSDYCKCGKLKRSAKYKQCRKCFMEYYANRTTKICAGCNRDLSLNAFRKRLNESRPRSRCRECESQYARQRGAQLRKLNTVGINTEKRKYYNNNKDRARMWGFNSKLKRMGIVTDPQSIKNYIQAHNGLCEICGGPPTVNENLSIDHCHATGEFRGLLCSNCNNGLGHFKDMTELLMKAAEYLNRHNQAFSDSKVPDHNPMTLAQ